MNTKFNNCFFKKFYGVVSIVFCLLIGCLNGEKFLLAEELRFLPRMENEIQAQNTEWSQFLSHNSFRKTADNSENKQLEYPAVTFGNDSVEETSSAADSSIKNVHREQTVREEKVKSSVSIKDSDESEHSWVFIPVDRAGQISGDDYYLPVDMFQKIYQKPFGKSVPTEERCFFRRASYSGSFSSILTSSDLIMDSIHAAYEIETILPETTLRFPFSAEQVYVVPGYSLLNGETVQIFWENSFPFIKIPKAGRYLLEFTLIPIVSSIETPKLINPSENNEILSQKFISGKAAGLEKNESVNEKKQRRNSDKVFASINSSGGMNGFQFSIPRIPNSQLKLKTPSGVFKQIEFPTAGGSQEFDQSEHSWNVQLGSASLLAVQWKIPELQTKSTSLLADELYSWQINEEGRRLQCRHRFQPGENSISTLEWSMDSRFKFNPEEMKVFVWRKFDALSDPESFSGTDTQFRLVPFTGKKDIQIRTEGTKHHVTLTFIPSVSDTVLTDFPVTISERESIGTYPIPFIRTEKTKLTRRWFQIVSESKYQLSLPENLTIPQVSLPEFQAIWNDFSPFSQADDTPSAFISALTIDDTQGLSQTQIWRVKAQPLPSLSMVQESLSCSFTHDSARVHYVIHLPSENVIPALFHLQIPEDLKVEKIVLKNQFSSKNLNFFQKSSTRLGIFHEKYSPVPKKNTQKYSNVSWIQRLSDTSKQEKTQENIEEEGVNFSQLSSGKESFAGEAKNEKQISDAENNGFSAPEDKELKNAENISAECRIELSGRIELSASETLESKIPFPKFKLLSKSILSSLQKINIYRTAQVLVTGEYSGVPLEQKSNGVNFAAHPPIEFENVRPVANFSISPKEDFSGFILIQPNRPKVNMECRTLLKMPQKLNSEKIPNVEIQETAGQDPSLSEETTVSAEAEKNSIVTENKKSQVNSSVSENIHLIETVKNSFSANEKDNTQKIALKTSSENTNESFIAGKSQDEIWAQTFCVPGKFWQICLEMILTVEDGLADEIVIEIPGDILTPFELDPPMPFHLETITSNEISEEKKNGSSPVLLNKNGNIPPHPEIIPEEDTEYLWTRMVIRPQIPFSGSVKFRLLGRLRDNQFKTSVKSGLIHLPIIRFPGINVRNHDVILPVFSSPNEKNAYLWAVEGMLPLHSSSLESPSSSGKIGKEKKLSGKSSPKVPQADSSEKQTGESLSSIAENGKEKTEPYFHKWRSGPKLQVFHIVESRYAAQLQVQNQNRINPLLETVNHSVCLNSGQVLLGISTLDIMPQNASVCILRVPENLKLLELHLDFMPVQIEEVFWNTSKKEFQPENIDKKGNAKYRFFKISLRSLQLPQRLEILFHGNFSSWKKNAGKPFDLELPGLIQHTDDSFILAKGKNGSIFFYVADVSLQKIWEKNGEPHVLPKQNSFSNNWQRSKGSSPAQSPADFKNQNSQTPINPKSSEKEAAAKPEKISSLLPEMEKNREITERPWIRVQLLALERLLAVARQVSAFQSSGTAAKEEKKNWFENWNFLRLGHEYLIRLALDFGNEPHHSEMRQNLESLQAEGNQIFNSSQGEEQFLPRKFEQGINDLKKTSLWLVFIRNIPLEELNCQAFDSGGNSDFRIKSVSLEKKWKPEFWGEAVYTFFFTAMILLGLYFYPSIPEEVRTAPFWLLSCGSLWLICGLNFWIGFALLSASVLLLTYRTVKMSWWA